MARAARAIIIENGKILVMYRNKAGSEYFTLVGGRVDDSEEPETALVREVKEETGLDVTNYELVYTEANPAPYNDQYIYLCNVAPHEDVKIQDSSEEGFLNRIGINMHQPVWAETQTFGNLSFRTPQLQQAIVNALKHGFPQEPIKI